jgi:hypothetical protein
MDPQPSTRRQLAPWLTPARFTIIIITLIFAAFPKVLLGLESFYYRDYGVLGYPFIHYHHAAFWRGELPLWNPLSNCGAPFLAQWGTMTLYPFSLFYLILPLPWSLTWFCFGHLVVGSLGVYYLAFRWSESRLGAGLAGVAFIFNGITFSCLLWPNYTVALGWMPWVVLACEHALERTRRKVVVAAIVATMQLLSGVPELILMTWVIIGALSLYRLFVLPRNERAPALSRLGIVVLLAAGLTAVQLLPFFDLLAHSHRDSSFSVSKWAMPRYGLGNFLVPLFHCFETPQGPFFQYGQEFLTSYYPGIGLLALAIMVALSDRQPRVRILSSIAILLVLLAFGDNGFLFPIIKRVVPLVSIARYPVKLLIPLILLLPLLAAFAIARWERSSSQCRIAPFAVCCLGLVLLTVWTLYRAKVSPLVYDQWDATLKNGLLRISFLVIFASVAVWLLRTGNTSLRPVLSSALILLLFADTRTHTAQQNPSIPVALLAPGLWQSQQRTDPPRHGESRVFITPSAEKHLLRNFVRNPAEQWLGQRLALWSNLNILDEIPKVNGSSTLQIREQMLLQKRLYDSTNAPEGLLDFLAVSQSSSPENLVEWVTRSNRCSFITVGQEIIISDDAAALDKLLQTNFNPRTQVFLAATPDADLIVHARTQSVSNQTSPSGEAAASIYDQKISAQRVAFRAAATNWTVCVIPQSFYHCWKASIDGEPAKLLRANVAFQAVALPPGDHSVVLVYRDGMFLLGLWISAGTLLLCLLLWRMPFTRVQAPESLTGL